MAMGAAVWYDQLTADESAQLVRGAGTIAQPCPDVLVVGGGIVGAATAAACHRAGAGSVLLVEAGRLGSGATGGAAGHGGPVIDRVPGLDNAWLTSGHYRTGILMAPATAQIITRWITASRPPPEAAAWSSSRFA